MEGRYIGRKERESRKKPSEKVETKMVVEFEGKSLLNPSIKYKIKGKQIVENSGS